MDPMKLNLNHEMDLIKLKKEKLAPHLDFVVFMLQKSLHTKFQKYWEQMYDCISIDRKKMTVQQINRACDSLMYFKRKFPNRTADCKKSEAKQVASSSTSSSFENNMVTTVEKTVVYRYVAPSINSRDPRLSASNDHNVNSELSAKPPEASVERLRRRSRERSRTSSRSHQRYQERASRKRSRSRSNEKHRSRGNRHSRSPLRRRYISKSPIRHSYRSRSKSQSRSHRHGERRSEKQFDEFRDKFSKRSMHTKHSSSPSRYRPSYEVDSFNMIHLPQYDSPTSWSPSSIESDLEMPRRQQNQFFPCSVESYETSHQYQEVPTYQGHFKMMQQRLSLHRRVEMQHIDQKRISVHKRIQAPEDRKIGRPMTSPIHQKSSHESVPLRGLQRRMSIHEPAPQTSLKQRRMSTYEQAPQPSVKQRRMSTHEPAPQPSLKQRRMSTYEQAPQPSLKQRRKSVHEPAPQSSLKQRRMSTYEQAPQPSLKQRRMSTHEPAPQPSLKQRRMSTYEQAPQPSLKQRRMSVREPAPQSSLKQRRMSTYEQAPQHRLSDSENDYAHPRFEEPNRKKLKLSDSEAAKSSVDKNIIEKVKSVSDRLNPSSGTKELVKSLEEALGHENFIKIKQLLSSEGTKETVESAGPSTLKSLNDVTVTRTTESKNKSDVKKPKSETKPLNKSKASDISKSLTAKKSTSNKQCRTPKESSPENIQLQTEPIKKKKAVKSKQNELDRLHRHINDMYDKEGIAHLSGPRACTLHKKSQNDRSHFLNKDYMDSAKYPLKSFDILLQRLKIAAGATTVKLDAAFIANNPHLEELLAPYLKEKPDETIYACFNEDLPLSHFIAKKKSQVRNNELKPSVSNEPNQEPEPKSPLLKQSPISHKRGGQWSRGIIKNRKRVRTKNLKRSEDEWEDIEETTVETKKQLKFPLKKVVEVMNTIETKNFKTPAFNIEAGKLTASLVTNNDSVKETAVFNLQQSSEKIRPTLKVIIHPGDKLSVVKPSSQQQTVAVEPHQLVGKKISIVCHQNLSPTKHNSVLANLVVPSNNNLPSTFSAESCTDSASANLAPLSQPIKTKVSVGNTLMLRPWIAQSSKKSIHAVRKMRENHNCLAAIFKCMGSTCSFFTSDPTIFGKHLLFHAKYQIETDKNFLICAYCIYTAETPASLISHVNSEHGYDRFQCAHCFYRAYCDFHVYYHDNRIHKSNSKTVIELEGYLKRANNQIMFIRESIRKFVPKLVCTMCSKEFFAFQMFTDHLNSHPQNFCSTCKVCGEATNKKNIVHHVSKCSGYGVYQCLYCKYGTDDFKTIDDHVMELHSSQRPVFCVRQPPAVGSPKGDNMVTQLAVKEVNKKCICTRLIIDKKSLANEENVGNISEKVSIKMTKKKTSEGQDETLQCITLGKKKSSLEPSLETNKAIAEPCPNVSGKLCPKGIQIQKVVSLSAIKPKNEVESSNSVIKFL